LISKGNFGDLKIPRFQPLSISIGRFFEISGKPGVIGLVEKRPSALKDAPTGRPPPMRLLIIDPQDKDRTKHIVVADPHIEAAEGSIDHRLVDTLFRLDLRRDSRSARRRSRYK